MNDHSADGRTDGWMNGWMKEDSRNQPPPTGSCRAKHDGGSEREVLEMGVYLEEKRREEKKGNRIDLIACPCLGKEQMKKKKESKREKKGKWEVGRGKGLRERGKEWAVKEGKSEKEG